MSLTIKPPTWQQVVETAIHNQRFDAEGLQKIAKEMASILDRLRNEQEQGETNA